MNSEIFLSVLSAILCARLLEWLITALFRWINELRIQRAIDKLKDNDE